MQVYGYSSFSSPAWPPRQAQNAELAQAEQASLNPTGNGDILKSSFYFAEQKIPSVEASGPMAAFRTLDAMSFLTSLFQQTANPVIPNINKKLQQSGLQTDTLRGIRSSLQSLNTTVSNLLQSDAFNTRSAQSSRSDLVMVAAGNGSPLTPVSTISVSPKQVSSSQVLVSNEQPSTSPALGLTGSFNVNGYKVSVVSTDSIVSLKNKINYGEDLNRNGVLNEGEGIYGAGAPEIIYVPPGEHTPGVYVVKDQNGKGYLAPSEDTNNNGRLDGGTKDTHVLASIANNRLVLTSQTGSDQQIDLQDPNNILLALGFFELNNTGQAVPKQAQYTTLNTVPWPPPNLNIAPQNAAITIDGKPATSDTNNFKGVVPDATLTVKQASDIPAKISISFDPANAVDQIKTLFNSFNDVITKINNALTVSKSFETDWDVQFIRNELTQTQNKILEATRQNDALNAVNSPGVSASNGLVVNNSDKNTLQEIAVTSFVESIRNQGKPPIASVPNDLLERLSSIGIKTSSDNTFSVNATQLIRALKTDTNEVLSLFNDPQTGVLPQLKTQLSNLLEKGIGRIDYKERKVEALSSVPVALSQQYRKYVANATLTTQVKTLIAVA